MLADGDGNSCVGRAMSDPVTMTVSMPSDAIAGKQGNIPIAAPAAAKFKQVLK
jgi:hypothetical protein